ncbi:unnamed protein product [Arctia plantaginis]|uniref:FLYWCH-type domain-containing protein n=1 Tax=Arctia plantaginis TaxID=874455 RepID=A0A8S0ZS28_ARCPL|nr:unnamed protein product [Arctia plantaginis]
MGTDRRWYCSKRLCGCKAKVFLDTDGKIEFSDTDHNHTPPLYHVTSTGNYIPLKSSAAKKREEEKQDSSQS